MRRLILAAICLALPAAPALAEILTITNQAFVEVVTTDANGDVMVYYVPPANVTPGDAVVFVITDEISGDASAEGVVLKSQIPADLTISEGSSDAEGMAVDYSIDGGACFAPREERGGVIDLPRPDRALGP